jgi:ribosomal protein S18 acetylase RimI-like enzyme
MVAHDQIALSSLVAFVWWPRRSTVIRLATAKMCSMGLQQEAAENGVVLVAEGAGLFIGFIAGWIVEEHSITETTDSRRAGYVSDICIMPAHRGHRIAADLLFAIERHFAGAGITRVRIASLAPNSSAQAAYRQAGYQPCEAIYEKVIPAG